MPRVCPRNRAPPTISYLSKLSYVLRFTVRVLREARVQLKIKSKRSYDAQYERILCLKFYLQVTIMLDFILVK